MPNHELFCLYGPPTRTPYEPPHPMDPFTDHMRQIVPWTFNDRVTIVDTALAISVSLIDGTTTSNLVINLNHEFLCHVSCSYCYVMPSSSYILIMLVLWISIHVIIIMSLHFLITFWIQNFHVLIIMSYHFLNMFPNIYLPCHVFFSLCMNFEVAMSLSSHVIFSNND